MNNRSLLRALAIAALVVAGAAAIGIGAYNAGVAQGFAESGRTIAAPPSGTSYVYVSPRPWGFGYFPIFPLFFLLILFFGIRGLLWRSWPGGRGCGYYGVPPGFDEWHRRAHEDQRPSTPATGNQTQP